MTKILIADDEKPLLLLTQMVFKDAGMDVITASNGAEAIEKALAEKPDIIITDVIMPYKTGFEVCKAVRSNPETADVPIIIISALGDEYNKLTGFDEGADDYVTKPFNTAELRARVKALLMRYEAKKRPPLQPLQPPTIDKEVTIEVISTGIPALDQCLSGGLPRGSNILLTGSLGSGKSSFARKFMSNGVQHKEKSLFVVLDDNPKHIRTSMSADTDIQEAEDHGLIRFVDAYSWSSMINNTEERFVVTGVLELSHLAGLIGDASQELGQSIQNKVGGRRVVDSISSLLINFDLAHVQRFINQLARTSLSFGGVTTLFVLEEGTVSEHIMNNIKYIMDGILEFKLEDNSRQVRVSSMKWRQFDPTWVSCDS
jgi:CheY-like chemotaxis protein/KaiC/GvpD/RAD55 family RecA-like ATPase